MIVLVDFHIFEPNFVDGVVYGRKVLHSALSFQSIVVNVWHHRYYSILSSSACAHLANEFTVLTFELESELTIGLSIVP